MSLDSSEPIIGPTEHKSKARVHINHEELPGLAEAALNHRVKLVVTGRVVSNRAKDTFGDGNAEIEIDHIEHHDSPKKENAATMHMDKLRDKIAKTSDSKEYDKEADKDVKEPNKD